MVKRFALISGLVAILITPLIWAQSPTQSHPFETLRGLERFNKSSTLSMHNNTEMEKTLLAIKGVKIGDNVLQQAIQLAEQGGQLGRIRGGTRSDKIKLSFYQPYEDSRLEQKVELYFDKHNGFIQQVTATYFLQDAYLSIVPIREQSLSAAVKKFGSPMTMQQAYDFSGQQNGEIDFDKFINGLQQSTQLHPLALAYLNKRNISRSSKWVKGEQDYALMHSGFDRCYLWHTNTFKQILTFCFFDKTSANPNSRGVELDLHDFPISQQITELGNPHNKPDIAL
ncbi:hypothetical protein [uncultured Paraglaciecola sp.]|uniref:hypothetical protein n=1 Tax=uncultured Paraglaciecola sp. TaxID=1765024 RepID=UPI0030DAE757